MQSIFVFIYIKINLYIFFNAFRVIIFCHPKRSEGSYNLDFLIYLEDYESGF